MVLEGANRLRQRGALSLGLRIWYGVADHFAARVADWFLATMVLSMGILFFRRDGIFGSFPEFYLPLSRLASQHVWAWACTIIGGTRLIALFINGTFPYFRWSPHLRFVMAVMSAVIWLQVALGLMMSGVAVLGAALVPYLALFDLYNAFLSASEAGCVERALRHERTCGSRSNL